MSSQTLIFSALPSPPIFLSWLGQALAWISLHGKRLSTRSPVGAKSTSGNGGQPNYRVGSIAGCDANSTAPEFKEIRKEWKARKKEEEAQRKAEEERHRQAAVAAAQAAQNAGADPQAADGVAPTPATYPGSRQVQLPPIGYQPTQYPAPPSAGLQQGLPEYGGSHVYSSYQTPASPYAQPNQGLYNQRKFCLVTEWVYTPANA